MSSFSFTGKLPEHWEGDIYPKLVQAAGWRAVRINDEQPDGTFHATITKIHHADIADIRASMRELGIEIVLEE